MGALISTIDDVSPPVNLYRTIIRTIDELMNDQSRWTDPAVCSKLIVSFKDTTKAATDESLINVGQTFGIMDKKAQKDKNYMCKILINEFKRRINLLKIIKQSIIRFEARVEGAKQGPVCRNSNVFSAKREHCPGVWLSSDDYQELVKKLKRKGLADKWVQNVSNLQATYNETLQLVWDLTRRIKIEMKSDLSPGSFTQLEQKTKQLLMRMDLLSDIYYIIAVNQT